MGKRIAVQHEADHELARSRGTAEIDVAEEPFMPGFVVHADMIHADMFFHEPQHRFKERRLEGAALAGDDAVGMGSEKADQHLLAVFAHGELRFVAVPIGRFGADDGEEGRFHPADLPERVRDTLVLDAQLLLVTDMAEDAPAAFRKGGAIGLHPRGGGGDDLFYFSISDRFRYLEDADVQKVAFRSAGDE